MNLVQRETRFRVIEFRNFKAGGRMTLFTLQSHLSRVFVGVTRSALDILFLKCFMSESRWLKTIDRMALFTRLREPAAMRIAMTIRALRIRF